MLKFTKIYGLKVLTSVVLGVSYWGINPVFALTPTPANSWADILQELREEEEEEPPLASRGEICAIAPGLFGDNNLVWSVTPLFFWRGIVEKIEVRSRETDEVLWSQIIPTGTTKILYQGQSLAAGQSYVVYLNDTSFTFRIVDSQKYTQMEAELKTLTDQLLQQGENPEAIARQRANYFVQENLWSDVFREMLQVENPSEDLGQLIEQVPDLICPQATRGFQLR